MFDHWNPQIFTISPLFEPLFSAYQTLSLVDAHTWPNLLIFNQALHNNVNQIVSGSGKPIHFIKQQKKSDIFAEQYEPKIFLSGAIQMREQSWHDFFNALVWLTFPKTKAMLNQKQYFNLLRRQTSSSQRTAIENTLTLFDENGAIVLCSNPELSLLMRQFQWKELFWQRRQEVLTQMRFFIFGHSLYEKALHPYIGITASSIILDVASNFLSASINELDQQLEKYFALDIIKSPRELYPLPVLGVPGWTTENDWAEYYDNKRYFRPGRAVKQNS